MSLRSFHIFFISVSILLSAFLSTWSIQGAGVGRPEASMSLGVGAGVLALGLVAYLIWFVRKKTKPA